MYILKCSCAYCPAGDKKRLGSLKNLFLLFGNPEDVSPPLFPGQQRPVVYFPKQSYHGYLWFRNPCTVYNKHLINYRRMTQIQNQHLHCSKCGGLNPSYIPNQTSLSPCIFKEMRKCEKKQQSEVNRTRMTKRCQMCHAPPSIIMTDRMSFLRFFPSLQITFHVVLHIIITN